MSLADAYDWFAGLALRYKVLAFATSVVLVELGFRRFAPKSQAYAPLDAASSRGSGSVWTAVHPVDRVPRLGRPDRPRACGSSARTRSTAALTPEPSFWRAHEPNPLGPERAARHQF